MDDEREADPGWLRLCPAVLTPGPDTGLSSVKKASHCGHIIGSVIRPNGKVKRDSQHGHERGEGAALTGFVAHKLI
jgi:hypothetical protein